MSDRKSEIASRILQGEPVELALYAAALGGIAARKPPERHNEIAVAAALDLTFDALRSLEARAMKAPAPINPKPTKAWNAA